MVKYCIQDTKVNKLLFKHLLELEALGFSRESINLEHQTTSIITQQTIDGFEFDLKSATFLISKFNRLLKETEEEVYKTFKPKWVEDIEKSNLSQRKMALYQRED